MRATLFFISLFFLLIGNVNASVYKHNTHRLPISSIQKDEKQVVASFYKKAALKNYTLPFDNNESAIVNYVDDEDDEDLVKKQVWVNKDNQFFSIFFKVYYHRTPFKTLPVFGSHLLYKYIFQGSLLI